jgi:hypothetical protein
MKNVVETVVVLLRLVVSEAVTDVDSLALQANRGLATRSALQDVNLNAS